MALWFAGTPQFSFIPISFDSLGLAGVDLKDRGSNDPPGPTGIRAAFLETPSVIAWPQKTNGRMNRAGSWRVLGRVRIVVLLGTCLLFWSCGDNFQEDQPVITIPPQVVLGDPVPGLSADLLAQFEAGQAVFERVFTPEEGLGPLFNGEGCASCHSEPVPGGNSTRAALHATREASPTVCDLLLQEGGFVIQQKATPLLQAQGIEREEVPLSATGAGFRTSPPLFGLGLVEAIPAATILANEDPEDADGDGISGRANRFPDGRLGRFGRKAFVPGLLDFTADAFLVEQGITSPIFLREETINGQPIPAGTDPAPDPEIPLSEVEAVVDFMRFLAAPARRRSRNVAEAAAVFRGEQLFRQIGCARCHIPSMQTGPSAIPALSRKTVFLYSDLLLHDMGPNLADMCLGLASPAEFRTEMLMGLRFRNHFLHDRRVFTVRESIELHGGEASASRLAFEGLSEADREALLTFLDTL